MEILLYTKLKWSVSAEHLQFYFNFVYSNISNFTIKDFNNHWQWNKFWKASTFNNFMLIVLFYQGLFFVIHFAVPRSPLSLWEWSRGGSWCLSCWVSNLGGTLQFWIQSLNPLRYSLYLNFSYSKLDPMFKSNL